ncbi:MAG: GIY-YIG nuclease family protein [Deltaproteobacteria bacterium]|nr:GIY-YIG nuclease family protein [Deltaproteobacteria bacterium]
MEAEGTGTEGRGADAKGAEATGAEAETWYVYLLECRDGTLYTGIAKDVARRIRQHEDGTGARYTRGRGPFRLLGTAGPFSRGEALQGERSVKRVRHAEKLKHLSTLPRPR